MEVVSRVGSPAISPSGKWVAYTVRETNWDRNSYETEIWLADTTSGTPRQLTNAAKSSNSPVWSPDGRLLAFASDREGKRQIYLINPSGGEAEKLTSSDEGVGGFDWAPDGASTTSGRPRKGAAFWTAIGAGAGVAAALITNAANPACDKPDNMCSANVVVFGRTASIG